MRVTGFCHRLLSISSTRASFVSDEIASPAREVCSASRALPVLKELPPVGRTIEEPSVSRRLIRFWRAGGLRSISSLERGGVFFLLSPAISRASAAPVAPTYAAGLGDRSLRDPRFVADAEIVPRWFREETTAMRPSATSIDEVLFLHRDVLRRRAAQPHGTRPLVVSSLGAPGFAAV